MQDAPTHPKNPGMESAGQGRWALNPASWILNFLVWRQSHYSLARLQ